MSTRTQYEADLAALKGSLARMGQLSADAVEDALEALCTADAEAAKGIIKGDTEVNRMERDIIAPDDMVKPLRRRVYEQLRETLTAKEFDRLDAQSSWDEQVTVCSTQMVKGLEYDAVMVVQPGSIEENAPSRIVAAADLYVAMTRPTQRLLIVRTNADEKLLKL